MDTSTTHTHRAVEPYLAHQGEARWYGDSLFEFLIASDVTGGAPSVFRATLAEGFSPPRRADDPGGRDPTVTPSETQAVPGSA